MFGVCTLCLSSSDVTADDEWRHEADKCFCHIAAEWKDNEKKMYKWKKEGAHNNTIKPMSQPLHKTHSINDGLIFRPFIAPVNCACDNNVAA